MQQYATVVTQAGLAKIAAAIAAQGTISISAVAAGDGNGAAITAISTRTALVHELWRGAPTSVSRNPDSPTQVQVTFTIPSSVAPCTIREVALFTSDGLLFAIASYPDADMITAAQGGANSITVTMVFVIATAVQVTIVINPDDLVPLAQLLRAPFIAIDSFASTPPANPTAGALVVVGNPASGAFTNWPDQFAQWDGVQWLFVPAPAYTIVGNSDGRYWQRLPAPAGWKEINIGCVQADWNETDATKLDYIKNKPGVLQAIYPEIITTGVWGPNTLTVTANGGTVVVAGGQQIRWYGQQLDPTDNYTLASRTFATAALKSYHLRAFPLGGFALYDVTDATYNPLRLAETNPGLDTTYANALVALVVTDAQNAATVTPLINRDRLLVSQMFTTTAFTVNQGATSFGTPNGPVVLNTGTDMSVRATAAFALNWARTPKVSPVSVLVNLLSPGGTSGAYVEAGANLVTNKTVTRYGVTVQGFTDWSVQLSNGGTGLNPIIIGAGARITLDAVA